jgi:hypothetical protein
LFLDVLFSIVSVITFNPNSSLYIMARDLAFLIMSFPPSSPAVVITRNPDSLPCSWSPFPSNLPMTWNIFRWWRWRWGIVPRLWGWIVNLLRWLGWMGKELIGHCS